MDKGQTEVVEYSVLLEYAVAYLGEHSTYIIYSPTRNETVDLLVEMIRNNSDADIMIETDASRAKGMCSDTEWADVIDRINTYASPEAGDIK